MKFRQISIRLERADAERAEALLNLADALALSFDDASDTPLFEPSPGTSPLWPQLVVHALFPADYDADSLATILTDTLSSAELLAIRSLDDPDWHAGLNQEVFVQSFTDKLCVVPADFAGDPPAQTVVRLPMGLAFGTGRHPTTTLCLRWLAHNPPQGLDVCDFGCGSGILAIAACRLGAARAIAIDNDPQAVRSTSANARLNAVEEILTAGAIEDFERINVDLVLANILAGTLEESVALISGMLAPGGTVVMSGILAEQTDRVVQRYSAAFESFESTQLDGWACITAQVR